MSLKLTSNKVTQGLGGSMKVFSKIISDHHDTCIKDSAVPGPGASLYEEKSASDLQMDMSVPLLEASS